MFASLMPGLRDVRTPMAVGLLWITIAGVWGAQHIPDAETASGMWQQLYRFQSVFGSPVILSILAFCGYLVGLVFGFAQVAFALIGRRFPGLTNPVSWQSGALYLEAVRSAESSMLAARRKLEAAGGRPESETFSDRRTPALYGPRGDVAGIASDIGLVSMRLQGSKPSVFDSYDRLKAEGEFRTAVAVPVAVLLVSLSFQLSNGERRVTWLVSLVAIAVAVILLFLAWRKSREANDLVIQSVVSGLVESPTIEALDAQADFDRTRLREMLEQRKETFNQRFKA